jgi:plasmid maintenance system antidote protein VapI
MQIYLDCDGVLADFDSPAELILGEPPRTADERLGGPEFWLRLQNHKDFFRNLQVHPEGKKLYEALHHLHPVILTGCPPGGWAEPQKLAWAREHFPDAKIICCLAKNKRDYMRPGDILIDDYLKYRELWIEAGGHFIHFQNAEQTLRELNAILGGIGE